jgi:hypothetical protein
MKVERAAAGEIIEGRSVMFERSLLWTSAGVKPQFTAARDRYLAHHRRITQLELGDDRWPLGEAALTAPFAKVRSLLLRN